MDRSRPEPLHYYGIAAKRYALCNVTDRGKVRLRKYSEHGLGHLLSPIPDERDDAALEAHRSAPHFLQYARKDLPKIADRVEGHLLEPLAQPM